MSTPTIPQTMKAVITTADSSTALQEVPVPEIDADEILVKTTAVASNPADWKLVKFMTIPGTIVGVDFAGVVVKVGSAVTTPAVGTKVAGFVIGGQFTDRGAYAEYVKTAADLVWTVPEGTVSDAQAATYGCAAWTAVQNLFLPTRLGLAEPSDVKAASSKEWVFIYGGSTSVGQFAIQLAHAAGYKVVTVASPKHHELLKSYGADAVFDYKDSEAITKIKETTGDSIHLGLDAVSTAETEVFSVKAFATGAGKLHVLGMAPEADAQSLRPDISIQASTVYTTHGRALGPVPAQPQDKALMVHFLKKFPELVKSGALKPNPTKLINGGLAGIPEGFEYMLSGKVSGEKVVYEL
ncbi:GroES-like protein [Cristinia sonorae]|uniref:GroES-like protein n=1 Tax=Cristinia sonorae TaxID=1940300 RepID=A0A8K0UM33_9AGAR|nr:GroES-like protein [Cristinia sonorae]